MEADHILYGWIFFTLVTLLLIAIGMTFADSPRLIAGSPAQPPAFGSRLQTAATMAGGLLLAMLRPGIPDGIDRASAAPLPSALLARPTAPGFANPPRQRIGGPWVPELAAKSTETYRDGDAAVTEFVALYRLPAVAAR